MISTEAKESFGRIFEQAVRSRLVVSPDDTCEIRAIEPFVPAPPAAPGARRSRSAHAATEAVVLTISALSFRLLVGLAFNDDTATRSYFAGQGELRPLRDAFTEVANLFCGAMNQVLVAHFPDLGMSTPYVLEHASLAHWAQLRPQHCAFYAVTVAGSVQLAVTFCVCANAPVDFVASATEQQQTTGELELF